MSLEMLASWVGEFGARTNLRELSLTFCPPLSRRGDHQRAMVRLTIWSGAGDEALAVVFSEFTEADALAVDRLVALAVAALRESDRVECPPRRRRRL
jgi:hypothetical protein